MSIFTLRFAHLCRDATLAFTRSSVNPGRQVISHKRCHDRVRVKSRTKKGKITFLVNLILNEILWGCDARFAGGPVLHLAKDSVPRIAEQPNARSFCQMWARKAAKQACGVIG
jgi:hypothetical protein